MQRPFPLLAATFLLTPCAAPLHGAERKPNWTEVFDLALDPCELKNLAADPAATAKLSAEFDAQVKAVNYAEPPGADRPRPPAPTRASCSTRNGKPSITNAT